MKQRWWNRFALTLAIAGYTAMAGAQQTVAADRPADVMDTSVLSRPVTIRLDRTPLRHAVMAVANAAGVQVQFRTELLDAIKTPVTLRATRMPLGEALGQLLTGTKLQVVPIGTEMVGIEPLAAGHQQGSGVRGVVTDAGTKHPVSGASVTLDSMRPVTTKDDGTFFITGISSGVHRIVVRRIGYKVSSTPVTVKDEAVQMVVIALTPAATALTEVVTTATGDRKRYEVGNAVGTIKADSIVPTTLIRNMSDLLQARLPGVVVENTSGDVGAPSKIRLRGVNSIALNNDPIIILDGVRLNAQTTVANIETNVGSAQMLRNLSNPAGGNGTPPLAPSRLDDIDPNTIESIDVLRGPSASSLYGTDAANGVIVIKTKKGHAGAWRTSVGGDMGESSIPGEMPEMWWGWGHVNGTLQNSTCNLAIGGNATVAGGGCVQDSVTQFNPQNDAAMRTLGTGTNHSLNANLSGGTESMQQFFSMRASSSLGMTKMSDAEQRLIARLWTTPAPSWMVHPNTEQDFDGSARTTVNVSQKIDLALSVNGIYRNVLNGGNGLQSVGVGSGASPSDTLGFLPSEGQRTKDASIEKRGTLSVTGNYRPLNWLSMNAIGGGDYGLRNDQADLQAQYCDLALQIVSYGTAACPSGHTVSRGETFVTTLNGGANLTFHPLSWLNLGTALGEQYSHTNFYNLQAGNSDPNSCPLQFGTTLLTPNPICTNSSAQQYAVAESRDEAATAGIYLEETVNAFGLYTTFGVRQDVASAFGGQVTKSPPNYPKFNFSYPLSDQGFFPKQSFVSSLRLRLAYGQSGNQASQTAILNQYSLNQITYPGSTVANNSVLVSQLGNSNLKPEKGTEWEGGFDVSFLDNERVHAEVTLYRKYTRDAIVALPLAPSYGEDNLNQYVNLGNVENRGLEVQVTTKLIDTRSLAWDLTINGSKNSNKLVHRASTLNVNGPLNTQFREGYPLYGYWGLPVLSYGDANGDGFLEQNEVAFGQQVYMGAPYPKGELTYSTGISLWNGNLRFNALLDQVIGQTTQLTVYYSGNYFPRAAVDRTAPLGQQAAYIQAALNNNTYLGTSSTVRLNELSATYNVPVRIVRQVHAQSLSVTLAGRNLALWSSYAGKDPDVDTSGLLGEASQDNGLGTPQPRSWALRFNLGL